MTRPWRVSCGRPVPLKGFLQDALVGRAHLSEAEGGSQGWSGAEVPKGFKQQACAVDGFLQECMVGSKGWSVASVKQQANVVEDFLQQAVVLKHLLREAMAGRKDLVEEAAFGSEAAKAPGAVDAAAVEVGEISRNAPAQQAAKHEAESWPDFARLASAVKDFVHRAQA